jgi:niacin transporter
LKNHHILSLTISGLLIAVGVVIPMFSPLKVFIEPAASFTLASHVAVFIAMFISPPVAVCVAAGTALGFSLSGFPPVVVLRAATHIIFAFMGSVYLHNIAKKKLSVISLRVFSFFIGVIHAVCEVIVSSVFYFSGNSEHGFVRTILILVGVGTVIHSMVDFEIARVIIMPLKKQKVISGIFDKC